MQWRETCVTEVFVLAFNSKVVFFILCSVLKYYAKDFAFDQLWEDACITLKIQVLHSVWVLLTSFCEGGGTFCDLKLCDDLKLCELSFDSFKVKGFHNLTWWSFFYDSGSEWLGIWLDYLAHSVWMGRVISWMIFWGHLLIVNGSCDLIGLLFDVVWWICVAAPATPAATDGNHVGPATVRTGTATAANG